MSAIGAYSTRWPDTDIAVVQRRFYDLTMIMATLISLPAKLG